MNARSLVVGAIFILIAPWSIEGNEWTGYVSAEARLFENDPMFESQKEGASLAVVLEPEYYREWNDGAQAFEFGLYGRLDTHDDERNLIDLRELSYLMVEGDWEVRAGVSKVFWGVAS